MAETAAHLVDHVLPHVPVRQWVLTLPMPLRYRAGFDPALASAILELFLRTVFGWLRRKAREEGVADGRAGAVTVIQRAGGSLNANLHYHSLVLDGVYVRRDPGSKPRFHATAPPSQSDLADILTTVRVGLRRLLERRGLIRSETGGDEADPHAEAAPLLAACYAALVQGTVAMGPKAGHDVGRLGGELAALPDSMPPPASCVRAEGYSLHAGVRVAAGDRPRLEKLCRYVARPALALDRLQERADGRFAYRLRHAWSDGTETLIFEPGTLIEKLVALVPRPNGHLTRFHGVLAPRSSWRAAIVPRPAGSDEVAQTGAGEGRGQRAGTRPSWAMLLSRVFAVDILECPGCGARRQVIAVVMDPSVVRAILEARGLPAEPPARSPARPPPQPVFDFPDGA